MARKLKHDADWRNTILKIRDYSEEQFDRLIIYLSTGALVITIGFVKDILDLTKAIDKSFLIKSWVCYILAILLMLLSHRVSVISMNYELKDQEKVSDRWDILTKILNWASFLSLIIGIILFLLFLIKNL
jgi:hypothetical protein